jgi:asparagine synthase (glutamine-hydrolysing)
MCGIFGSLGIELDPRRLRLALESIRHRGPDDWGVWASSLDGSLQQRLKPELGSTPWSRSNLSDDLWGSLTPAPITLGHVRLTILDLTRESHQPMLLEESGASVALVFNGEIYNYIELRAELRKGGYNFESTGDSEVVLKSYLAWGPSCVNRFNGFFAFAIWDGREKNLFAARDRLGQKPFYFHQQSDRGLFFASEIKAFWHLGLLQPQVDKGVATRYLGLGNLPVDGESFFDGISQLPSGCTLRWQPGQTQPIIEKYWQPTSSFDGQPVDASQLFRERLIDSVRLRYRSDVPVGICLSGGVDSSNLMAASSLVLGDIGQGELHAFSATHHQERWNESSEVMRVLAGFPNVQAHYLDTTTGVTYQDFIAFLRMHDEPISSDGIYNQFRFMQQVNQHGMKVMLSGQGADELFLGYPWYIRQYVKYLLKRFHISLLWDWVGELRKRSDQSWFTLVRDLASSLSRRRVIADKRSGTTSWMHPSTWDAYCQSGFLGELKMMQDWTDYHSRQIFSNSLLGLLKDEDRNSMGHSIETRLPYLDYRLVEWALTISPEMNLQQGNTKFLVRSAFMDQLPEEVIFSKMKTGFYVPYIGQWPEHQDHLDTEIIQSQPLAEIINVQGFMDRKKAGQVDSHLLWRVFNLAFAIRNATELWQKNI